MRALWSCLLLSALAGLPSGAEGVSARQAFWRSLLVPGWGQHYLGRSQSAARFLTAELILWSGHFAFVQLGDLRKDNFRAYAAEHARVRPAGKDKRFFDDLGFYQSWLEHNQYARREEGPNPALYPEGAEFFWEWDQEASRQRYRKLRQASEKAQRQALYATGLVVVNHLVAAVHAAHGAAEPHKGEKTDEVRIALLRGSFDPLAGRIGALLVHRF